MTVLHIHHEIINKGGAEVYLAELQTQMPKYGHISYWLGLQTMDDNYKVAFAGEDWQVVPRRVIKKHLTQWIRKSNIDLICIHNLFDSELADYFVSLCPVVKFSHSPVIVCPGRDKFWRLSGRPCTVPYGLHCFWHIYTEGCSNRNPKSVIKDWNFAGAELKRARNKYSSVIVMSEYNRQLLLECDVPPEKICVNPYFTPFRELTIQNTQAGSKKLLFAGRIIAGKGVLEMIQAVEPLIRNDAEISLDIIGDGLLMHEAKALVLSMGLGERITFFGWLPHDEIARRIAKCYLVVFPSTYPESFGIVGIEAMMSAKPVVAFDVGGVSTWLKNNRNGFIVPSRNIVKMREAIDALVKNKDLYEAMCKTAREMAVSDFIPEVHMGRLNKVFADALSSKNHPDKMQIIFSE